METDPVCGMRVNRAQAAAQTTYRGETYYFCSPGCVAKFAESPERYVPSAAKGKDHPPGSGA